MGKLDFDNLCKLMKGLSTINAGNVVSVELPFNLPRGYIAKIRKIIFKVRDTHEDIEGLLATVAAINMGIHMALVRDPDDTTTILIPDESSGHDVLAEFSWSYEGLNATNGIAEISSPEFIQIDFDEGLDVITARNLRFNCVGVGADAASLTETQVECIVHYTYERVTDDQILQLLDIL
jgi:hypothetical protein